MLSWKSSERALENGKKETRDGVGGFERDFKDGNLMKRKRVVICKQLFPASSQSARRGASLRKIRFSSLFAAGDVSRETFPAAKSEEKRIFSQATAGQAKIFPPKINACVRCLRVLCKFFLSHLRRVLRKNRC